MPLQPPRISKAKLLADSVAATVQELFGLEVIRKMAPGRKLQDIVEREVRVWPQNRTGKLGNRNTQDVEYTVAIVVLQKLPADDQEDIQSDDLLGLVESIADRMLKRTFGEAGDLATAIRHAPAPFYDQALLEETRLFAAGIALTLTRHETLPTE